VHKLKRERDKDSGRRSRVRDEQKRAMQGQSPASSSSSGKRQNYRVMDTASPATVGLSCISQAGVNASVRLPGQCACPHACPHAAHHGRGEAGVKSGDRSANGHSAV
jgi:hypothetical protein